ncbi:Uncharacterised protein [Mycobacteroides abscessus subsp. abscessus]|nr:Uncharacterised protein [Mycobacteroides abscessus subsp. abscessus]
MYLATGTLWVSLMPIQAMNGSPSAVVFSPVPGSAKAWAMPLVMITVNVVTRKVISLWRRTQDSRVEGLKADTQAWAVTSQRLSAARWGCSQPRAVRARMRVIVCTVMVWSPCLYAACGVVLMASRRARLDGPRTWMRPMAPRASRK